VADRRWDVGDGLFVPVGFLAVGVRQAVGLALGKEA
jgi:hypothetical protein